MKLTIDVHPGELKHYGALAVILSNSDNDDWVVYGGDAVESLGYWLDCMMDGLMVDDFDDLVRHLERALSNVKDGR